MTYVPARAGENAAVEAATTEGVSAAVGMAHDWYCPKNPDVPRRACPGCVAEVAVAAAYPVIAEAVRAEERERIAGEARLARDSS